MRSPYVVQASAQLRRPRQICSTVVWEDPIGSHELRLLTELLDDEDEEDDAVWGILNIDRCWATPDDDDDDDDGIGSVTSSFGFVSSSSSSIIFWSEVTFSES